MRPFVWFVTALLLFLAAGVTVSISRQRALLLQQVNAHIDREFSLLEAVVADDLLKHDYAGIRHYLTMIARHDREIAGIKATSSNGFVLLDYNRELPAVRPLKRSYRVERGDRSRLDIELIQDLQPLQDGLSAVTRQNILASTLFAGLMAVFLWYVLRKKAFIPLETALEGLNRANASLEGRVAERTAELMRANIELKNEIKEREAAEKELVIKDLAITTAVSGIAFTSLEGIVTYVNDSCVSMWGYGSAAEAIGRPAPEFWQSPELAESILGKLRSTGVWFGELVARRKDGSFFDVQLFSDTVKDKNGQPICVMSAIVDITERKRAEAELRAERDFTTAVLQTVGAIVLVLDREGRIVRFNRECEQLSGYTFEEVRSKFFWEFLMAEEQRDPARAMFEMLTAGKFPSSYENVWVTKSGARRMIAWANTCLTGASGAVTHVIATGIDVTESRAAAEALAASEAKHRMVVENIGEIIYSISLPRGRLRGTIDFLSGSVPQSTGYQVADFMEDPDLWISLIHPEDLAGVKEAIHRMARDRAAVTRVYRLRCRGSEQYVWHEDRIVPRYEDGKLTGYFGVARDITRRKQAEEGLREALIRAEEEKNKSTAIIAAIGDGISIQDRDFRIIYQNARHSEMVGNHLGEFCYRAIQKADSICSGCPVTQSFKDGKVHITERSRMTEFGRVYVEVAASPLRDADGNIIAGIELVRDITARKKAEEDVRRAYETQYVINALLRISVEQRSMQHVLQKALKIILSSSWYVALSQGAIFLFEEGGKLALTVQQGLDPEVLMQCAQVEPGKCLCGRAIASGEIQFASHLDERHDVRFDGIRPHGNYSVPIASSGKKLGVLSLCLEDGHPFDSYEQEFLSAVANALAGIIERKRLEGEREQMIAGLQSLLERVSASRQEWQETFDSITDMISIHDSEHRIIRANKAFARNFGLDPRDVIHKRCHELFHESAAPIAACPQINTLATGEPASEEVADPKTGRMFLISTFPFFSPESKTRGIVHIARDITEAKEYETRMVMTERLAALGKMASGIAHEINNPLAAIAGCVDGMNRRISRGEFDQELFRKYLSIMKEELTRSKNITTSMLSIVQTKDYERRAVRIHETIAKSLEIIGYQGRLKEVNVSKKLAEGAPLVQGSEGELKQVLLIIFTNALDAMDDKGTLTVETAVQDRVLSIVVRDTGPGIAPENLGRVFDPFFTTKSKRGGTGLGLSIANRIITAHNGHIRLSSSDSGTSVFVELPAS